MPCRMMPHKSEPQWSQKVGEVNVLTLKRCGMLMLKRCCSVSFLRRTVSLCALTPGHFAITRWWHFLCSAILQSRASKGGQRGKARKKRKRGLCELCRLAHKRIPLLFLFLFVSFLGFWGNAQPGFLQPRTQKKTLFSLSFYFSSLPHAYSCIRSPACQSPT